MDFMVDIRNYGINGSIIKNTDLVKSPHQTQGSDLNTNIKGNGNTVTNIINSMTDIAKKVKNATQDAEAKIKTEEDHAKGKPSSETVNKANVKLRDALT